MDINKILKADYLDILFEGRNKLYGGYELRKKYPKRMAIAGIISILVIGGLFASTLIKIEKEVPPVEPPPMKEVVMAEPPPLKENQPPPPPPPPAPPPVKPTVKFTPPVIKPNEEVKKEDLPEPPKDPKVVAGPANIEGTLGPDAVDPGLSPGGTGTTPTPVVPDPPKPTGPLRAVQQMPQFPGGREALMKYLRDNIRYPLVAAEQGIEGQVVLEFVVDENGEIGNITVKKDLGGGCTAEAKRVVAGMPKWTPGKQNGRAVAVYYSLPVTFRLDK
jgi:protein TonB